MVAPRHRSGSLRKKFVRTPSSRVAVHRVKRKPGKAQCGMCGGDLKAVPKVRAMKLKTLAKTKKRPQRPYGGHLCSPCMRKVMIDRAREGVAQ